jgi:hypothetical protein
MLRWWSGLALALACGAALAQNVSQAPIASLPVVEIRGTVAKVQFQRGAGPPALEVKTKSETAVVRLGSMRYLMEQNFNPKAGDEVVVKGYRASDQIIAITVRTPANNREIRLRDENGWPVWNAGCCGGRR